MLRESKGTFRSRTSRSRSWTTLVGAKPMGDLKVLDLETGEFQTLIRGIDPRDTLEFGLATPP